MIKAGNEFPSKTCCYPCLEMRKSATVSQLKAGERRRQRRQSKHHDWEFEWGSVRYADWSYYEWDDIWEGDWETDLVLSTRQFAFGWLNGASNEDETVYTTR